MFQETAIDMFILVSNKVFIENKMNVNKITDVSTMTIFLQILGLVFDFM